MFAQAPTTSAPPVAADQALRDLAAEPWMPFALLIGTAVVAYVLVWFYRRHAGRARSISQVAAAHGLHYTPLDGSGLRSVRFSSFGNGDGVDLSHMISHRDADGVVTRVFDYSTWVERVVEPNNGGIRFQRRENDGPWWQNREGEAGPRTQRVSTGLVRTGAAVGVPAFLPRLVVRPESLGTKAVDALGGRDIQLESDEFNRLFDVRSPDRRFAQLFLDAGMIDLLVQTEARLTLEVFGNWMLLTSPLAAPADFPALLGYVRALRDAIPELVREMYPEAADASRTPGFRLGGRTDGV